jgi:transcription antitermination factor NusG
MFSAKLAHTGNSSRQSTNHSIHLSDPALPAANAGALAALHEFSQSTADPWMALRTRCRHESVVESFLQQKRIAAYLPKLKGVRKWQGRTRGVEMPLFPGYVFVRPRADQYEGMRYIRGSCGLVLAADRKPATMSEKDIAAVRMLVESGADLTVDAGLVTGQRVKIVAGPLMGVEGELVRVKNQQLSLVINVDLVGGSVRVEVDRDTISVL